MDWYKEWEDLAEHHTKVVGMIPDIHNMVSYWEHNSIGLSHEINRLVKLCKDNNIDWRKDCLISNPEGVGE
jgi:hypothetical protein